jgi:NarL family two-component system response regulator LiaR
MQTPTPPPIRVALVDDQRRFYEMVATLLATTPEILLIGYGSSGEEALALCQEVQPDVLLMDVVMPGMGGLEATRLIRERFPGVKVLVLSSYHADEMVQGMLKSGATGYILKASLAQDLVQTIKATFRGQTVLAAEVTETLLKNSTLPRKNFDLTERELEVLQHLAQGLNNAELAAKLFISVSTVKFHILNIQQKMGVDSRAEVIVLAAKHHLI